jgi:hypothetical protein
MRNSTQQLGTLQQEILRHIFQCDHIETFSHLVTSLRRRQPTVFKSVKLLHKLNYLESKINSRYFTLGGTQREIAVTDKGAAVAITLGVPFDQIESYQDYKPFTFLNIEGLDYICKIIKPSDKRQVILEKAMHYALENNFFDKGQFRLLGHDESEKLKLFIALESIKSIGDVFTLIDFVNRYRIDKNFLKKHLNKQKRYIDSLINALR